MEFDENQKSERRLTGRDGRTLALLGLELTGLIVAAVALGLIVGSCGEQRSQVATTDSTPDAPAAGELAAVASHAPATPLMAPAGDDQVVAFPDSLPPEVTAFVADSVVTPGAAVEITAQASVDATDLTLWDGFGKRQSFVYDDQGKVWKTYYRAPLRSAERLGLSVTARNESGRWRRVWLFLRVAPKEVVEPGSAH